MTRVANLAQNRLIQHTILNTQERIQDRQLQISTLQKSQNYAGIASDSNRLVTLEASRKRVEEFLNGNNFVQLRMESTLNSISSIKSSLDDVRSLLFDILDDGALPNGLSKDDLTDIKMAEIKDFLNTKVNGRYIFAGSKTDQQPVVPGDLTTAPTFDASYNTTAEPSFYYQGDDATMKARIEEGVTLNYGATAADPGFEKLIRVVRIIRSTSLTDPNATQKFQNALDLLNTADTDLSSLELNVGSKLQQLDTTNKTLKDNKNFIDGVVSDLESANTFEAVSELQQDQSMLEASYNTLVRLSHLTLNDFLRG